MMRKTILAMLLVTVLGHGAFAEPLDIESFTGLWEVDFDRTMEAAKQSPKYDPAEAERMPDMIKRMMGKMKIRLTGTEMVYLRGSREMALPFSVSAADEASLTLGVKQGDQEATIVLNLIDGEFLNFKSSGSDDMDYYIWRKAETTEIAKAAEDDREYLVIGEVHSPGEAKGPSGPVVWTNDFGFLIKHSLKEGPEYFVYTQKPPAIHHARSFDEFAVLLGQLPDGVKVDWIKTCGTPIFVGMPPEHHERLEEVVENNNLTLMKTGEDATSICRCGSTNTTWYGSATLKAPEPAKE